jgi:hypothetical protein
MIMVNLHHPCDEISVWDTDYPGDEAIGRNQGYIPLTELRAMVVELERLRAFYRAWVRAESNRGCYSCAYAHDSRCPVDREIGACECGRDELNRLEKEIDNHVDSTR